MAKVVIDMSMSLDGYVAGPADSKMQSLGGNGGEHLHDWLFSGAEYSRGNSFFRPEGRNCAVVDELLRTTGAMLTGKRTYDITDGWRGDHPISGITVVVLTHNPPPSIPQGSTRFIFCGEGIQAAVDAARGAAGDKTVIVQGASACQQALRAALVDEIVLHIAPITLGGGTKLFEPGHALRLKTVECLEAPYAIHAKYRPLETRT